MNNFLENISIIGMTCLLLFWVIFLIASITKEIVEYHKKRDYKIEKLEDEVSILKHRVRELERAR